RRNSHDFKPAASAMRPSLVLILLGIGNGKYSAANEGAGAKKYLGTALGPRVSRGKKKDGGTAGRVPACLLPSSPAQHGSPPRPSGDDTLATSAVGLRVPRGDIR